MRLFIGFIYPLGVDIHLFCCTNVTLFDHGVLPGVLLGV